MCIITEGYGVSAGSFFARLVFFEVFFRNIVFRRFMRVNFPLVGVIGAFYTGHRVGLKCISFLNQLAHTFGICFFDSGYSLQISGLPAQLW